MKYEVGTKVRIKKDLHVSTDYTKFVNSIMAQCAGKIAEITAVYSDAYAINLDGGAYYWTRDMFEPIKIKEECIVIYRKDREVIALDKSTGKTAMAKCHLIDEFDFAVGAKLAFDRLIGTTSEETTPTLKFKVGDKVIANAKASKYYGITREGWKGYVTQVPDNDGYMRVDDDKTNIDHGYIVSIDCFELDDGPEYFNGKVVCVESRDNFLTKGKIYEFDDGISADDNDAPFPYAGGLVESVEELNRRFQSDFIEVVE